MSIPSTLNRTSKGKHHEITADVLLEVREFFMKRLIVLQSILIVLLVSIGVTINHELSKRVDEKEKERAKVAEQLSTWKNEYEYKLTELEMLIEANKESLHQYNIEQVSFNQKNDTVNYDDWKKRREFVSDVIKDSQGKFQESWAYFLVEKAIDLNVDPYIVYNLIKVETGGTFDPNLVGPDTKYGNARGLGQIMHSNTAAWLASLAGLEYYGKEQLFDPYFSIELTVVYLDFLYRKYGNWEEALTAYNRGMYGLEQYKARTGHAKSSYATKILQGINGK